MIRSFADADTERLFLSGKSRRFGSITAVVRRKLQLLDNTPRYDDLRVLPGNRLESLNGDRRGQHSVRINDQYRICFRWDEGDAYRVEIADYD